MKPKMTPTTLQRIKEIETAEYFELRTCFEDVEFLLKAFNVMREIAINLYHGEMCGRICRCKFIDEEFEERMSK